jgi:predicted nucleotidyltransferase
MSSNTLTFNKLPDLPQIPFLKEVVTNLWQQPEVVAVWLGGSLARGEGDPYSDIDLRVAVETTHIAQWENPKLETFFGHPPLAHHVMRFGDNALLHHLLVKNGDIRSLHSNARDSSFT